MKLLDYFRNHNELVEILIEGSNPYATNRLSHDDVDVLRQHLGRDERIRAYAQGRSVGHGRTVWVVTDQALIVLHTGSEPIVRRIALGDIQTAALQKGRYGQALSVQAGAQRASMYGLARTPAVITQRALLPKSSALEFLPEDEVQAALSDLLDLQMRAQPVLTQTEAQVKQLMTQLASRARDDGLLHETVLTST